MPVFWVFGARRGEEGAASPRRRVASASRAPAPSPSGLQEAVHLHYRRRLLRGDRPRRCVRFLLFSFFGRGERLSPSPPPQAPASTPSSSTFATCSRRRRRTTSTRCTTPTPPAPTLCAGPPFRSGKGCRRRSAMVRVWGCAGGGGRRAARPASPDHRPRPPPPLVSAAPSSAPWTRRTPCPSPCRWRGACATCSGEGWGGGRRDGGERGEKRGAPLTPPLAP